jgi:DNA-directed RNA polymerase specialized sigma24 family protein
MKLAGYLEKWRGEGPFTHYLTTIIRKECARKMRPDTHFVALDTLADVADPAASVENEIIQQEEAERMVAFFDLEGAAMERLIRDRQRRADLRQRSIFWVKLLAHLPYDAIMSYYQVDQTTAQQMIDNFRKRLQRFLRACYPGLSDQTIVHLIVHGTEEEL